MAFVFDHQSTDTMTYGDIAALDSLANMSICFIVDLTSADGTLVQFLGKFASSTGWQVRRLATNVIRFNVGNGTSTPSADSTTELLAGKHTVGVSYNGSADTVQFCIDGVGAGNPSITNIAMGNSTALMTIGKQTSNSLGGSIEQVMIWDVALTLEELQSYHAGEIPRPASMVFWQPCHELTQPDLIGNNAATNTGVTAGDGVSIVVPSYPAMRSTRQAFSVTALLKIINETLESTEGKINLLGLLKIINETLQLPEGKLELMGLLKIINEILGIQDGDNNDVWDPAGKITETMSDGTVWTGIFPPFTKRTRWS